MILNAETGALLRQIDPVSDIKFMSASQSFKKAAGEVVSLVLNRKREVCLICFNQA